MQADPCRMHALADSSQDFIILFRSLTIVIALLGAACALSPAFAQSGEAQSEFATFLAQTRPLAQAAGVSATTYDAATAGLTPDPGLLGRATKQGEFSMPVSAYLAQSVTAGRVSAGRAQATALSDTLGAIEQRFGVAWEIIVALWGVETSYGSVRGEHDVLRSLATLAIRNHRGTLFRDEFIAALVMIERGHVPRDQLVGSWAGAMGQPQFMPSSYLKYAVALRGSGIADIWRSREDSLGSIANFMKQSGWQTGLPALVEVIVPAGFDWEPLDLDFPKWRALGFVAATGEALPASGNASLFLPQGAKGPAFLITDNFEVIRQYNTSDAYALSVALLAERIAGGAGLKARWPSDFVNLSLGQRTNLQRRLLEKGFYSGTVDGRIGRATRVAVHAFQIASGIMPADGHATPALLAALGAH